MSTLERQKLFAEEAPITDVDLMITERCNLACSYCFHTNAPATLDIATGKKIIDRLWATSPDNLLINFFGGEPTLCLDMIIELSQYAVSLWGNKVKFAMSTNGMIFNQKAFEQLFTMNFAIQVSIDGDKATTLQDRIGVDWDQLVQNIQRMLAISKNISARATVTPANVYNLAENMKAIADLGITRIMHHPVIEAAWKEKDLVEYEHQMRQIYMYRRLAHHHNDPVEFHFCSTPMKIINQEKPAERTFCLAGRSYLAIMPNGDTYPCHRCASKRIFKLGNILTEGDPIIRGMFLHFDKKFTGCIPNCRAASTCHSCFVGHYNVNGDITKPVKALCDICQIEHKLASEYLPTELGDRRDRKIDQIMGVVSRLSEVMIDVASSNIDYQEELNKLKGVPRVENEPPLAE